MIAFFGGAFDPVHFGHLKCAQNALNILPLSALFLMPYKTSQHKKSPLFSDKARLAMLKATTKNTDKIFVDDREIKRGSITYTIDSLRSIRLDYPNENVCFLLGVDSFNHIDSWQKSRYLSNFCHLIVFTRPNYILKLKPSLLFKHTYYTSHLATQKQGLLYLIEQNIDISSRNIRYKIAHKKPIDDLVPKVIVDYIKIHQP